VLLVLSIFIDCQSNEEVNITVIQENKEYVRIEAKISSFVSLPKEKNRIIFLV